MKQLLAVLSILTLIGCGPSKEEQLQESWSKMNADTETLMQDIESCTQAKIHLIRVKDHALAISSDLTLSADIAAGRVPKDYANADTIGAYNDVQRWIATVQSDSIALHHSIEQYNALNERK